MNLLEDIQNSAIDTNSDLATLLRKCKLLATRLGIKQLEDWVRFESNGYPPDSILPNYRILPMELKGNFLGLMGAAANDFQISTRYIPEHGRDLFQSFECKQSVASIEHMIRQEPKQVSFQISVGDCAHYFSGKVFKNMSCTAIWGDIASGSLIELLNAVRNSILDFSLKVWEEYPDAGEIKSSQDKEVLQDKLIQIFTTTVTNGSANIIGSANHSHITFTNTPFDFESLKSLLLDNRISEEDIQELSMALGKDPKPTSIQRFGPNVASWIGKMLSKAASGAWDISIEVSSSMLFKLICKYYGLV